MKGFEYFGSHGKYNLSRLFFEVHEWATNFSTAFENILILYKSVFLTNNAELKWNELILSFPK